VLQIYDNRSFFAPLGVINFLNYFFSLVLGGILAKLTLKIKYSIFIFQGK
jgi:hypothetical protein